MIRSFLIACMVFSLMLSLLPGDGMASDIPVFSALFSEHSKDANDTVSLGDYRGKQALVVFWNGDCAACVKNEPVVNAFANAHPALPVLLVSLEDRMRTSKYFEHDPEQNVRVVLPLEDPRSTLQRFGDERAALPFSLLLRADGTTCQSHHGPLGAELMEKWMKQC